MRYNHQDKISYNLFQLSEQHGQYAEMIATETAKLHKRSPQLTNRQILGILQGKSELRTAIKALGFNKKTIAVEFNLLSKFLKNKKQFEAWPEIYVFNGSTPKTYYMYAPVDAKGESFMPEKSRLIKGRECQRVEDILNSKPETRTILLIQPKQSTPIKNQSKQKNYAPA